MRTLIEIELGKCFYLNDNRAAHSEFRVKEESRGYARGLN